MQRASIIAGAILILIVSATPAIADCPPQHVCVSRADLAKMTPQEVAEAKRVAAQLGIAYDIGNGPTSVPQEVLSMFSTEQVTAAKSEARKRSIRYHIK